LNYNTIKNGTSLELPSGIIKNQNKMKPTLQVQFFLNKQEHCSASLWISHKEELQNWVRLVLIATAENQFPAEAIYIAALDEQRSNCLN